MTDSQTNTPSLQPAKVSISRENSALSNETTISQELRRGSILKNRSTFVFRKREDNYGQEIKPNSKEHKICFSEKLNDVKVVENWKTYNQEEDILSNYCCGLF